MIKSSKIQPFSRPPYDKCGGSNWYRDTANGDTIQLFHFISNTLFDHILSQFLLIMIQRSVQILPNPTDTPSIDSYQHEKTV